MKTTWNPRPRNRIHKIGMWRFPRKDYHAGYSDGFLGYTFGSAGFSNDDPKNIDYLAGFNDGCIDSNRIFRDSNLSPYPLTVIPSIDLMPCGLCGQTHQFAEEGAECGRINEFCNRNDRPEGSYWPQG